MQSRITKNNTGFTLIELLVSIALFSVVLTVTLGSIMTIADSNKKARSLMSVTNNLNFAVDSMVRSFKTGNVPNNGFVLGFNDECFQTVEVEYDLVGTGGTRNVDYCFDEDENGRGQIIKTVNGDSIELTSPDVDIEYLKFTDNSFGNQPLLKIVMEGNVKVSEKINSSFSIQTSISQRRLEI
jgi:prepilin-type N-terminal cleavage/methylation domain-containing protein